MWLKHPRANGHPKANETSSQVVWPVWEKRQWQMQGPQATDLTATDVAARKGMARQRRALPRTPRPQSELEAFVNACPEEEQKFKEELTAKEAAAATPVTVKVPTVDELKATQEAIRKLEGWVRGALAKADAHIADTYGPARTTTPPLDLETV